MELVSAMPQKRGVQCPCAPCVIPITSSPGTCGEAPRPPCQAWNRGRSISVDIPGACMRYLIGAKFGHPPLHMVSKPECVRRSTLRVQAGKDAVPRAPEPSKNVCMPIQSQSSSFIQVTPRPASSLCIVDLQATVKACLCLHPNPKYVNRHGTPLHSCRGSRLSSIRFRMR